MRSSMFIVFPLFILLSLQFPALARPHQLSIDACQSSQFPRLCLSHLRSFLSVFPSSSSSYKTDLSGFAKHSVEQSLKHARKLSEVIKHHFSQEMSQLLSRQMRGSLRDCLHLTDSTVRYLESILAEFDGADLARSSPSLDIYTYSLMLLFFFSPNVSSKFHLALNLKLETYERAAITINAYTILQKFPPYIYVCV